MKKTQRQQWQQRQRQWQMKMTRRSTWGHIQVVSCSVLSHPVATRGCCTKLRQPNGMCRYTHTPIHTHTLTQNSFSSLFTQPLHPPLRIAAASSSAALWLRGMWQVQKFIDFCVCLQSFKREREQRKGTGKGAPRGATEGGSETGN